MYFIDFIKHNTGIKFTEWESRPKTSHFMQYTGLKDKRGKEIYEGDILEVEWVGKQIIEVYWHERSMCFDGRRPSGEAWNFGGWNTPQSKVIGNIYENKELLKEVK